MEQPVVDYLTKQIQIGRNVVTFRSLSRHFNIHVNAAKNTLAAFHAASHSSSEPVYATYMLTGEVTPPATRVSQLQQDDMEVDNEEPTTSRELQDQEQEPDSEVVPLTRVLLVGENDVERAKAQYIRVLSQVVYSLSPARLIVRQGLRSRSKLKVDASVLLGRLVGLHVHVGKPVVLTPLPVKASVAPATETSQKQVVQRQATDTKSGQPEDKPKFKPKEAKSALKPRASGILDWGKAKAKQKDEGAKEKEKAQEADETREKGQIKKATPVEEASKKNGKRGVKRKSALPASDEEEGVQDGAPRKKSPVTSKPKGKETVKDEKPSTSSSSSAKASAIRRKSTRAVMLDSDDDESHSPTPAPPTKEVAKAKSKDEDSRRKTKTKVRSSVIDKSLKAMMDIDDDEVDKASRPASVPESEVETEEEAPPDTQTEDVIDDSEPERMKQRPQKKKKQAKKPVPVGRNGLKKRRVMRTRTKTDEKGYMVTEDYSSYESVDEEEAEEPAKGKGKGKKGASVSTKGKKNAGEDGKDAGDAKEASQEDKKPGKTARKPPKDRKSAGKAGQGTLTNFFK
ncbi:DNA polymerase subunit Cdc27-domain-containing protein [Fomitopsis serialis]|uniref:DNA polymerase subunit Cdc27-domain-containing protein n=1 Tax=Fomitopsis serialis TaxID=139415 RepID=UPI002008E108|nr:DNA polymerase subunit Cdc27-domain-containing protein [Neoantrodia serialis]KAH9938597.1 DNA polymerase subunit Cdc27-domain-containing protein [Neoantrodia serialis]